MARYQLIATLDVDEAALERHREAWPRLTPKNDDPTTWSADDLLDLDLIAYQDLVEGDESRDDHPVAIVEDSEHALTIERLPE